MAESPKGRSNLFNLVIIKGTRVGGWAMRSTAAGTISYGTKILEP